MSDTLIHVVVQEKYRDCFSHKSDHDSIGIVFDETDTHIYIKPIKRGIEQKSFVGSVVRYPKNMIIVEDV